LFAKLFDTKHGQFLVFMNNTDTEDPYMTCIVERDGVRATATISWHTVAQQEAGFARMDQTKAEEMADMLVLSLPVMETEHAN
jgi:hypothetical protein